MACRLQLYQLEICLGLLSYWPGISIVQWPFSAVLNCVVRWSIVSINLAWNGWLEFIARSSMCLIQNYRLVIPVSQSFLPIFISINKEVCQWSVWWRRLYFPRHVTPSWRGMVPQ